MNRDSGNPTRSTPDNTAREELAGAKRELQLILDALPAFIFYKDAHNRILRVNRAAAESHGVRAEDMENTPTEQWYPDEAARYFADDLEVIRSGQPKRGIVEPIVAGKEKRWVQTEKFPQFDRAGDVIGIVVVAQDITERLRLEQELSRSRRLDSVGRLAGGVAHDFNNLLTAIIGHVEVIQEETPKDSPTTESLEAIHLAVQRCAELTGQLLAFARKQPHRAEAVDLNALVTDARRILGRVIEENIEFSLDLAPFPTIGMVDAGQISQVLINLAINARDAMPDGGTLSISTGNVEITSAETSVLAAGRYVFIDVEDSGKGITDEERQHLFEPFFTTKELGSGIGLGLATAYGIVRKNGGIMNVESQLGVGTRFRILLPASDAKPESSQPFVAEPFVDPPSATVLFVEDDLGLRELGTKVLTRAGYPVISAANGEEALQLALTHGKSVQLLITDVVMPKMGGLELAERLKTLAPQARTIFMSGYADVALVKAGALHQATLLSKPFTRKQLLERVKETLGADAS